MTEPSIVGVRFGRSGRVVFCRAPAFTVGFGELVVVRTDEGPATGRVVVAPEQVVSADISSDLPAIIGRPEAENPLPQPLSRET